MADHYTPDHKEDEVMNKFVGTAISLALVATATMAFAAKKPKGAKPTDPNQLVALYSGKTSHWNSGGFAYWGPSGEYQGLSKTGNAVGLGKWYVTSKGRMCHETTWYWDESGATESKSGKWCWEFVTDPEGVIWESFQEDKGNWYRQKPEKQHSGNTARNKIQALRAKLGV